mmetsp:Transcript_31117/g.73358  ORF Transcript_31117/g.73358 Transcript_31117/m.73358 type:complete len:277 (+) Transcript_31117:67-897(+)
MSGTALTSKLALITGGGGTIGKAIAKALLTENFSVVLTGRRLSRLEEVRESLLSDRSSSNNKSNSNSNATVYAIPSDVTKEDSVVKLFRAIDALPHRGTNTKTKTSSIDLLVNNAGINSTATLEELTASELESVLGVNVVGAFLCAREAIVRMKQASSTSGSGGGGRIINIGSISAFSPRPNSTAYTTSKFAINGLSRSLALDVRGHGISVGTIHPGNIVSELLTPEEIERRGRTEGFLRPEDVANCVVTMAALPASANVLEMTVIPTTQPLIGRG